MKFVLIPKLVQSLLVMLNNLGTITVDVCSITLVIKACAIIHCIAYLQLLLNLLQPIRCFNQQFRRATRNFRGQGSRRQKGHNKKFCVKGISLRLCSLDLETEEIFEAFS